MNAPEQIKATTMAQLMAQSRRWLLWKSVPRANKKPTKIPYYIDGTPRGTTDTPEDIMRLATYQEAQAALHANRIYAGIGFALGPDGTGNFWQGIDFDGISQRPQLVTLAKAMAGYRETSPSGDGLHWIGYGATRFENMPNYEGVEAYASGRFFTYTGKDVFDHPVVDLGATVAGHLAPLRPDVSHTPKATVFMSQEREDMSLDDLDDLLERIPVEKLGYFDWLNVLMGVHHQFHDESGAIARAAFDAVDKWSAGDIRPGSYIGERKMTRKWNSFGNNPALTAPGAAITIKTVKAMAQRLTPLDLDEAIVDAFNSGAVAPNTVGPFGSVHIEQFMNDGREQGWLIKGVLPDQGVSQIYGDTQAGKTFQTIDMMFSVTRGIPWCGHKVRQGNVVYIAAEGAAGARKRFRAYGKHHDIDVNHLPVIVLQKAPNLMDEADFVQLGNMIAAMGRVDLVVVDTLAQVMGGANENGSEGMGLAIARLTQLAHALQTMVMVVHHSGKDSKAGARGWSGQKGALDAQFEVVSTASGARAMTVTKMKDGITGRTYAFRLKVIQLGIDADGDEITSCVAVQEGASSVLKPVQAEPPSDDRVRGIWQEKVMRHIGDHLKAGLTLKVLDVVQAVVDASPPTGGKKDRRRDNVTRAITELEKRDVISISGEYLQQFDPTSRKASMPYDASKDELE